MSSSSSPFHSPQPVPSSASSSTLTDKATKSANRRTFLSLLSCLDCTLTSGILLSGRLEHDKKVAGEEEHSPEQAAPGEHPHFFLANPPTSSSVLLPPAGSQSYFSMPEPPTVPPPTPLFPEDKEEMDDPADELATGPAACCMS